jgi:DNA adenine methylase
MVGKKPILLHNKKKELTEKYVLRLEKTQIENNEALKVLNSYDKEDAFHYVDPPYFNADMGHYKGYTEADFENLLQRLSKIKGKFLLSCYPSEILDKYIKKNGWKKRALPLRVSASHHTPYKRKIEMLVWNYNEPNIGLNGPEHKLHPFFMLNRMIELIFSYHH